MVRLLRFYQSSVGKKVVGAVTGAIMYGFIIGHMLGNLKASLALLQLVLVALRAQVGCPGAALASES